LECSKNNHETASLRAPRIIDRSGRDRRRADVDDDVEDAGSPPPVHAAAHTAAATRATVASPPRESAPARADRHLLVFRRITPCPSHLPDPRVKWTNGTPLFSSGCGNGHSAHRTRILHRHRDPRPPAGRRQPGPRRVDPDRAGRQTLARSALNPDLEVRPCGGCCGSPSSASSRPRC